MLGENHGLNYEFPEFADKIQLLKNSDATFNAWAKEYHSLDHEIRGLENNDVPTDDLTFMQLKTRRAHLKDELYKILTN
ncbi:hypothetical protein CS022_17680 [Veronia nyctiphanis]|uniref:DUF465 domain-containing protein n=1 Tax=Veronia nyctiphanis TaxID=1278244 RepID=A0A4Q0YMK4_9GAMM|nr:DUF465 domain-containing protein [Veronia nyctiphanis]RXJ72102.1 hypothetical protein CS022_17680 [Veronia nyctiphanis]